MRFRSAIGCPIVDGVGSEHQSGHGEQEHPGHGEAETCHSPEPTTCIDRMQKVIGNEACARLKRLARKVVHTQNGFPGLGPRREVGPSDIEP